MLVQISRECTPPYLSTGISILFQPAQAEVVLGQLSRYLVSWFEPFKIYGGETAHIIVKLYCGVAQSAVRRKSTPVRTRRR
jgi:hypothetical protein